MSVSNEPRVAEEAVVRLLRATRVNDAATAPKRHPRQTDQCPPLARFAALCLPHPAGTKPPEWTQEEERHTRGCAFCQDMFRWFRDAKAASMAAPVVDPSEETVTNLDTSEETQTGLTADTKKPASAPKPSKSQTKKSDDKPPKPRAGA